MKELGDFVSSFNESEVTQLLLKALEISNVKSQNLIEKVAKLQEKIREEDLNFSKQIQEKERNIKNLEEKIASLKQDIEKANNSMSLLKEETQNIINEKEKSHAEAIRVIKENHLSELNKKDSDIRNKDSEISAIRNECQTKDGNINQIKKEKEVLSKEFENFKVEYLKSAILNSINKVQKYSILSNRPELDGMVRYIDKLHESSNSIDRDFKDVDSLCRYLLTPDGILCSVCNLIWWLTNETVLSVYKPLLDNHEYLLLELESIIQYMERFNYKIQVPRTDFCDTIETYELYDNDISRINQVFPDISLPKSVLCEIYSVSYNDKSGKCYSL